MLDVLSQTCVTLGHLTLEAAEMAAKGGDGDGPHPAVVGAQSLSFTHGGMACG